MNRIRIGLATAIALIPTLVSQADVEILDKPLWIFPGQQFRVALRQPKGSGELRVDVPATLEVIDQWDQDEIQRYYFRGLKPGTATLRFHGKGGKQEVPLDVLAWADAYAPRTYKKLKLPRLWPLDAPAYTGRKSARTLHSDTDLAKMKKEGQVSARAERWLSLPDEDIYSIIPGPSVPRTCLMVLGSREAEGGVGKGCPVCGMELYKGRSGFYPWRMDPVNHPWKVQCPECKTRFPSNDWHKGDMHSGPFPDDGYGCEPVTPVCSAKGNPWRWPFIAYYHQWEAYMKELTPGIIECARAYATTGKKAYAHKTAIGLLRYAESMVDMTVNLNHRKIANRDGVYKWPVGAPIERRFASLYGSFMYIQCNWDLSRMENAARAWDLIFDQLADDQELLAFCQAHGHPEMTSYDDFCQFIEAGVLRATLQACLDNAEVRNYPQQEVAAATFAVALGTPRTIEVADTLLNTSGIRFALTNQYYKDGAAHESPSYNHIQIRDMARLFKALDRLRELHPDQYVPPRFVSPVNDPKFRRQYDFCLEYGLIGRTFAVTGDTGGPTFGTRLAPNQGYPCKLDDWINAYKATGDARFAQAMAGPNGSFLGKLTDPALKQAAQTALDRRGWQVSVPSNILDGYGHAILRSGAGSGQRTLWLRYARCVQHAHPDMLTYGFEALQRTLLPELGYPVGWTFAGRWETNWGTHYGTHITGIRATDFNKGELTTFVGSPPVQIAVAESRARRGKRNGYRQRTIALVDLADDASYAISLERVKGGTEHTFSFHGPDGDAETEGLSFESYDGTALGDGLAYGDYSSTAKHDSELSCLAFMRTPQRAKPDGVWSLDYRVRSDKNVHLKAFMVEPDGGEAVLAKGKAPGGRCNYDITWAVQRHAGEAELTRQYLNVLEPYTDEGTIQHVERLPIQGPARNAEFAPLAFRVTTTSTTDVVILQHGTGDQIEVAGITFDGEFGLWREDDGHVVQATLVRGTVLTKNGFGITMPNAEYRGTIVSCDWGGSSIVVAPVPAGIEALAGRHMRIANSAGSSASYQILGAKRVDEGCRIRFGLDPRIGEGFVATCTDGVLSSSITLTLCRFGYYQGKTLTNETGDVHYRLKDVHRNAHACLIDKSAHPNTTAAVLKDQFNDRDGDGLVRFLIYDYGPGDTVTMEHATSLTVSNRP
ncbi:MAG: hypothetical protein HN742_04860 [Lentisphaerae bacterium]|jgi:oligo-alginate lyase|nr:hypothetical protein [Lentisphaerota bacterium]MBT4818366.1 hypothetical protein [Lentisphaerota bacterium]MBT5610853.1 hypothetical protein [Lentisphaerota bacterium]MBT7053715.1 hypothetical protein [Lentisphaerota bacterium]MBT7841176.1 hypothetical protein [Lentisphaerota bacterium]